MIARRNCKPFTNKLQNTEYRFMNYIPPFLMKKSQYFIAKSMETQMKL